MLARSESDNCSKTKFVTRITVIQTLQKIITIAVYISQWQFNLFYQIYESTYAHNMCASKKSTLCIFIYALMLV